MELVWGVQLIVLPLRAFSLVESGGGVTPAGATTEKAAEPTKSADWVQTSSLSGFSLSSLNVSDLVISYSAEQLSATINQKMPSHEAAVAPSVIHTANSGERPSRSDINAIRDRSSLFDNNTTDEESVSTAKSPGFSSDDEDWGPLLGSPLTADIIEQEKERSDEKGKGNLTVPAKREVDDGGWAGQLLEKRKEVHG